MGEQARLAVEEWKRADAAAQEAEQRLKDAWAAYYLQRERAPGAELISEVSRLRQIANEKLDVAIRLSHPDAKPPRPRT